MKSRKKPNAVAWSQIRDVFDEMGDVKAVADRTGVSVSTVYRAIREDRDTRITKTLPKEPEPMLTLAVRLPSDGTPVVVQVRNGGSALVGTLTLESTGIRYRRPNAKTPADRVLSWENLDKIMQLGIM